MVFVNVCAKLDGVVQILISSLFQWNFGRKRMLHVDGYKQQTRFYESFQLIQVQVKQYLNTKCRRRRVPYGNGDAPRKRLQPCTAAVTSSSSASCAVRLQVPSLPTHSVPRHDRYHVSPERLQLTATTLFDWLNVIVASRMRGG